MCHFILLLFLKLLGNHDANPEHCYKPEGDWLYEAAGDLWSVNNFNIQYIFIN